jgi:hypothetical protein
MEYLNKSWDLYQGKKLTNIWSTSLYGCCKAFNGHVSDLVSIYKCWFIIGWVDTNRTLVGQHGSSFWFCLECISISREEENWHRDKTKRRKRGKVTGGEIDWLCVKTLSKPARFKLLTLYLIRITHAWPWLCRIFQEKDHEKYTNSFTSIQPMYKMLSLNNASWVCLK